MELVAEGVYRMTISLGIASVKGRYHAEVQLLCDDGAPYSFTLRASGAGIPGHFEADVTVVLAEAPSASTVLSYTAEVTASGVIGALGRHILTRAVKKSAAEFFGCLDRLLSAPQYQRQAIPWLG